MKLALFLNHFHFFFLLIKKVLSLGSFILEVVSIITMKRWHAIESMIDWFLSCKEG